MSKFDLTAEYEKKRQQRGSSYSPRTKHLGPDGWAKYTNRLFLESSPYLLQHAHNPVDWYPWGDEAFQVAASLKRPVLLSVGYSTCHWCHVMEEESFEDEEIASYINENYIAIKVDREERPDVDAIYMAAVQALTGRGGWPMTVWLTPERKPFFGGTYFPPRDGDRGSNIGFLSLLKKVREGYDAQKDLINQTSQELTDVLGKSLIPEAGSKLPNQDAAQKSFQFYQSRFDQINGGFKGAPKFPSSLPVRFLFNYFQRHKDPEAREMAVLTLDKMAFGGIYDHVGGGVHRYSTDEKWLVPHFEKMLYDNALLAMDYLAGYQVTGDPEYKLIIEDILQYVQRDMTSPGGGFYSATDADSLTPAGKREEGYFFTWTPSELKKNLGSDLTDLIRETFGVGPYPNFEGRYIFHKPESIVTLTERLRLDEKGLRSQINKSLEILRVERERRPLPLRDEKILTAWNGLMISAYARAGFVLNIPEFRDSAVRAAEFLLEHLYIKGRLRRSYIDGSAKYNGYLDDYAFFTAGLIDLYEATQNICWLEQAIEFDDVIAHYYEDKTSGGFFLTSSDHEGLIAREKPCFDGALPSGNAIAILNLLRLGAFTSKTDYLDRAEIALKAFSGTLASNPAVMSGLQMALDIYMNPCKEIIIIEPQGKRGAAAPFLDKVRRLYLPYSILAVAEEGEDLAIKAKLIPLLKYKTALNTNATAYVCENLTCREPTSDPEIFNAQLSEYTIKGGF